MSWNELDELYACPLSRMSWNELDELYASPLSRMSWNELDELDGMSWIRDHDALFPLPGQRLRRCAPEASGTTTKPEPVRGRGRHGVGRTRKGFLQS
jgi:hypothetical protein